MSNRRHLCVCGRSQELPWCDGSHAAEDWTCALEQDVPLAFSAQGRLTNLARKLAAHFDAALVQPRRAPKGNVDCLITVVDNSELLSRAAGSELDVSPGRHVVVGLGPSCDVLRALYPDAQQVVSLERMAPTLAFRHIRDQVPHWRLDSDPSPEPPMPPRRAFVSHAVADENLLTPVVAAVRALLDTDIFLCADSIAPGATWQHEIGQALDASDVFVLIMSAASLASTFCAFEVGVATGLGKPIHVISIDGTLPPAYIQHLHAIDAVRLQHAFPWLDADDIVLDGLLHAVTSHDR